MTDVIMEALKGHRLDTLSQDSGMHCTCGSDSRFEQRDGDMPWKTIDEHRADVVRRAQAAAAPPVPETVGTPEDVEVKFDPDDIGIKIFVELGEASITVEHAWEAASEAATLVQALPNIMMAVQAALDAQEA